MSQSHQDMYQNHLVLDEGEPALEPIAICGMSCRLPGGVDSASSLWDMLVTRRTGRTRQVPASRFDVSAYHHPRLDRPGSFNVAGGYFLDGEPEDLDPSFFGMTPVEAQWLDPQQRRMLEVVYECLESAGLTLDAVAGSATAVFVGCFTADYQQMLTREPDFRHSYAATGVDPGIIANRIGHVFDLRGPSFTVNTACSSSVYALHNACNALRARDCDAAVVGGVNMIVTVDQHMNTAKLGILSPTSTCHTFDADADGYGRAEGAGALYVKRLADAIRDGDPVRGVIRATAVNTNGKVKGMGITHPSIEGQERVVRMAYEKAGLDPRFTAYAELHGTGTPVGDPIEVLAISRALNDHRPEGRPLKIGAVKPNIGHSEAASGIFAVIKAALMTEAAVIPGVALFNRLNPEIHQEEWNVSVQAKTVPWPEDGLPVRRASVSSFGYGGTNGHVIVESVANLHPGYCRHGQRVSVDDSAERMLQGLQLQDRTHHQQPPALICFSAHDDVTLARNVRAISKVAHRYSVADLAHTLNLHRTEFAHRAFAVVRTESGSPANPTATLLDWATMQKGVVSRKHKSGKGPGIAYIFTGQGAQWVGMVRTALEAFPELLDTIRALDRVLDRLDPKPAFRLADTLIRDPPPGTASIDDPSVAQPLTTAIQIALVDLLARWNVSPVVSVGHSSGEIAAAYASGLLSAAEAITVAFCRGRAVEENTTAGTGSMLAVGMGAEKVERGLPDGVRIACRNSPGSVTLSGPAEAVSALGRRLAEQGFLARELRTGRAYHHPEYMAPVAARYEPMLKQALSVLGDDEKRGARRSRTLMVSSVTGLPVETAELPDGYWTTNLTQQVLFDRAAAGIQSAAAGAGKAVVVAVELGPHSALAGPFRQICKADPGNLGDVVYVPSFVKGKDDATRVLSVAGSLFLSGYPVDLGRVGGGGGEKDDGRAEKQSARLIVDLPPYQWNYHGKVGSKEAEGKKLRFWAEPRASAELRLQRHPRHDLLGRCVAGLSARTRVWRNVLRHRDVPWLMHHSLGGTAIFPAAGYLAAVAEALRQVHETAAVGNGQEQFRGVTFRDVHISKALVLPEGDDGVETITSLMATGAVSPAPSEEAGWYAFSFESRQAASGSGPGSEEWILHCEGRARVVGPTPRAPATLVDADPVDESALTRRTTGRIWYDAFDRVGFRYGTAFQRLRYARTGRNLHQAAGEVLVAADSCGMMGEKGEESRHVLHPCTVDACLHLVIVSIHAGSHRDMPWGVVPVRIGEVTMLSGPGHDGEDYVARATAWTDGFEEGRHFNTHARLVGGPDGEVLLDIKDMKCTAFEAALPQSIGDSDTPESCPDEFFSCELWKPDMDSLLGEGCEASEKSVHPFGLGLPEDRCGSAGGIVDLICHKEALRTVLLCGRPSVEMIEAVRAAAPRACRLVVGVVALQGGGGGDEPGDDDAALEKYRGCDDNDDDDAARVTVVRLPPRPEEWAACGDSVEEAGLVIVDFGSATDCTEATGAPAGRFFAGLGTSHVATRDGWLVAPCRYESAISIPAARTAGFGDHWTIYHASPSAPTATMQGPAGSPQALEQITILVPESATSPEFQKSASAGILAGVTGIRRQNIAEFSGKSGGGGIVIDDSTGTLFSAMTEAGFAALKMAVAASAARGLLWLTQGVREGSHFSFPLQSSLPCLSVPPSPPQSPDFIPTSPSAAMAEGFIRVALSEQPASRIVLLDASVGERPEDVSRVILDKLAAANTRESGRDNEFWLHGGTVRVCRICPHAGLNPLESALASPSLALRSDATYLLVGCLGGLGRSLTQWMMERGARHFAFVSRSGADKPEAARVVAAIRRARGTSAEVFRADAADQEAVAGVVRQLLPRKCEGRPVRGVVHAAMVLEDGMLEQMSHRSFAAAVTPKAEGAMCLDRALAGVDLDFFVLASSISAVLGNPGQANYSAGNSVLHALAVRRRARGEAASALALPMVLDVGMVAEKDDGGALEASLRRRGMYGIDECEMLRGFEAAMAESRPRPGGGGGGYASASSGLVAANGTPTIIMGLEPRMLGPAMDVASNPYWSGDARLVHVHSAALDELARRGRGKAEGGSGLGGSVDDGGSFASVLEASGPEAATTAFAAHIARRVAAILQLPVDSVDAGDESVSLTHYGLDSMVGAELRTWLFREFGLDLPFQKLLGPTMTLQGLATAATVQLGLVAA